MSGEGHIEFYLHIRVLISLVLGLGLTRLLTGISKLIQHPDRQKIYPTHLIWVAILILTIMNFWWWEFALIRLNWNFALFAFVLLYAFLFFLLASLLFPEDMTDYSGFEDYFLSRRRWFFGLLGLTLVADFIDTAVKGGPYLEALGIEYMVRIPVAIILCVTAAVIENRRFQLAFALLYLAYTISWIVRVYWQVN
ncbi:hypothetical protein [Altererythrobacter sp. Root672]|uniref:hypothetical protein n=1 Tax=Altererythrobacter sp. Root672 TaxID=1736584 RepID=UPI0006FE559A|nr:hypothetical protein [Altererythrobacter sp. Root672]KRA83117.1 hypothetical protein ASD76_03325 [Altererythrobacter sp. Root672]